jgi:hypothetical protein
MEEGSSPGEWKLRFHFYALFFRVQRKSAQSQSA